MTEEQKFLKFIAGSSLPLKYAVQGYFKNKEWPEAYAAGLIIGAGMEKCEHDVWGGKIGHCSKNHKEK